MMVLDHQEPSSLHFVGRRLLVVLLVANYALAVAVGPRFHSHSHALPSVSRAGAVDAVAAVGTGGLDDCCGHQASHGGRDHGPPVVHDYHDCPVCEFLSQQPVPPQQVRPTHSTILTSIAPAARALASAQAVSSPWLSRGPPLDA